MSAALVVLHLLDLGFSGFFKGLYLMLSQKKKKKGKNYATGVSAAPNEGKSLEDPTVLR